MTFFGADWWDAAQAVGTLAAVLVALGLAAWEGVKRRRAEAALTESAARHREEEYASAASVVSAWVETDFRAAKDGTHYRQVAIAHIANESDQPVFDVHVSIGVGVPPVQIGPLSIPMPIPVLPSRRERTWDVSLGLMAHASPVGLLPGEPVARIAFTDSRGVRWIREFDGALGPMAASDEPLLMPDPAIGEAQLGDVDSPFNPMTVATLFWAAVMSDPPCTVDQLKSFWAPQATRWDDFDDDALDRLRGELADFGLASHVTYPAPRVAYVKFVRDADAKKRVARTGYVEVKARILTLVFIPKEGWLVFSFGGGATRADWIEFPSGSLLEDLRGDGG